MSPVVSVIMPAYNAEKYINESIDSVLQQTFNDFEIIIVDDGSTDRTKEIVLEYNEKVNYLFQENGGPSRARNTGIKAARGKYIAFLDADDLWTQNKLKLQIGFLESHPDIDMVFADMMMFNEKGVILESYLRSVKRKNFYERLLRAQEELQDPFLMLLQGNFIPTGSVVIRKRCLDQVGLFDENLSSVEDLDFWIRLSIFSKIAFVPDILKKKRDHESNISKDWYKAVCSAIYAREKLLIQFPEFTKRYKRDFDKVLANLYWEKGYTWFEKNNFPKEARACFRKAFSHEANFKLLLYLLSCFLPISLIEIIRKIKNLGY